MDSSLAELVRNNIITMAIAETRASEPSEMRKLVQAGALAAQTPMHTSAPPVAA